METSDRVPALDYHQLFSFQVFFYINPTSSVEDKNAATRRGILELDFQTETLFIQDRDHVIVSESFSSLTNHVDSNFPDECGIFIKFNAGQWEVVSQNVAEKTCIQHLLECIVNGTSIEESLQIGKEKGIIGLDKSIQKHGCIRRRSTNEKRLDNRYLILVPGKLFLFKSFDVVGKHVRTVTSLLGASVQKLRGDFELQILAPGVRTISLVSDPEDVNSWVAAIEDSIEYAKQAARSAGMITTTTKKKRRSRSSKPQQVQWEGNSNEDSRFQNRCKDGRDDAEVAQLNQHFQPDYLPTDISCSNNRLHDSRDRRIKGTRKQYNAMCFLENALNEMSIAVGNIRTAVGNQGSPTRQKVNATPQRPYRDHQKDMAAWEGIGKRHQTRSTSNYVDALVSPRARNSLASSQSSGTSCKGPVPRRNELSRSESDSQKQYIDAPELYGITSSEDEDADYGRTVTSTATRILDFSTNSATSHSKGSQPNNAITDRENNSSQQEQNYTSGILFDSASAPLSFALKSPKTNVKPIDIRGLQAPSVSFANQTNSADIPSENHYSSFQPSSARSASYGHVMDDAIGEIGTGTRQSTGVPILPDDNVRYQAESTDNVKHTSLCPGLYSNASNGAMKLEDLMTPQPNEAQHLTPRVQAYKIVSSQPVEPMVTFVDPSGTSMRTKGINNTWEVLDNPPGLSLEGNHLGYTSNKHQKQRASFQDMAQIVENAQRLAAASEQAANAANLQHIQKNQYRSDVTAAQVGYSNNDTSLNELTSQYTGRSEASRRSEFALQQAGRVQLPDTTVRSVSVGSQSFVNTPDLVWNRQAQTTPNQDKPSQDLGSTFQTVFQAMSKHMDPKTGPGTFRVPGADDTSVQYLKGRSMYDKMQVPCVGSVTGGQLGSEGYTLLHAMDHSKTLEGHNNVCVGGNDISDLVNRMVRITSSEEFPEESHHIQGDYLHSNKENFDCAPAYKNRLQNPQNRLWNQQAVQNVPSQVETQNVMPMGMSQCRETATVLNSSDDLCTALKAQGYSILSGDGSASNGPITLKNADGEVIILGKERRFPLAPKPGQGQPAMYMGNLQGDGDAWSLAILKPGTPAQIFKFETR